MEKMSTITFPDGSSYEIADAEARRLVSEQQQTINEQNNKLMNENNETFNFGVLNGVRGFFTDPSRADDSFVPFKKSPTEANATTIIYVTSGSYVEHKIYYGVKFDKPPNVTFSVPSGTNTVHCAYEKAPKTITEEYFTVRAYVNTSGAKYAYLHVVWNASVE